MTIAPHEGREIELVLDGTKPLATLKGNVYPKELRAAINTHKLITRYNAEQDVLVVVKPQHSFLIGLFGLLSSTKANFIVRSKEEKHRLLGRLFGYSEEDIDDFIAKDMKCACGQCKWD